MKRFTFSKKLRCQKGQSSLEFFLVATIFFLFMLFHVVLSLVFMGTSYIDYAGFMASRASVPTVDAQVGAAEIGDKFNRVLSTYLRIDGEAEADQLSAGITFFNPIIRLADNLNSFLLETTDFRDPESRATQQVDLAKRNVRVKIDFDHLFYLGAAFLPGGEDLDRVAQSGVSHHFRREPTLQECRDYLARRALRFVFSGNILNDPSEVGAQQYGPHGRHLYDNGC